MLYLLDANVLIDAERNYYGFNQVPEFWDWLLHMGETGQVKMPQEIFDEIVAGVGALPEWLKKHAENLLLIEEADPALVSFIVDDGYGPDPSDEETQKMGQDPFLIAYGLANPALHVVVSNEGSRPSRQRANRHVPDVCDDFSIECITGFELFQRLNFSTAWRH